jgi:hypothetical protein
VIIAVTFLSVFRDCAVCGKSIFGRFGKQGYQCKGEHQIEFGYFDVVIVVVVFVFVVVVFVVVAAVVHSYAAQYYVLILVLYFSDCKLATHKKCHFQTSDMCSNSSIKNIEM